MPAFRLKSAVHPGRALVPPPPQPIFSVVRLTPVINGVARGSGTGFWVDGWSSTLITARHVIEGAHAIRVRARGPGGIFDFDAVSIAYPEAPDDFAVVCVAGAAEVVRRFRLGTPTGSHDVRVIGYPATVDVRKSGALSFESQAKLTAPWLELEDEGLSGMSGGPVVSQNQVIGVYVGPRDVGGAFAFATDANRLDQAMQQAVGLRDAGQVEASL